MTEINDIICIPAVGINLHVREKLGGAEWAVLSIPDHEVWVLTDRQIEAFKDLSRAFMGPSRRQGDE